MLAEDRDAPREIPELSAHTFINDHQEEAKASGSEVCLEEQFLIEAPASDTC